MDGNPALLGHRRSGSRLVLRRRHGFLNGAGGGADHVEYEVGAGDHRDVTRWELVCYGAHALRGEALEIRMDGAVARADDVTARLRPPGDAADLLVEQVGDRRHRGRPCELPLLSVRSPAKYSTPDRSSRRGRPRLRYVRTRRS